MERHACKVCNRYFSNRRALGGHMRSHVVAIPAADASIKFITTEGYSSSSTSCGEAEEGKGLSYGLRENPRKSYRMVDPEFSTSLAYDSAFGADTSVVQDRESETESFPQPSSAPLSTKRLTKRPRPSGTTLERLEAELLNSYSDVTPEEDLAITFMLLSRDVWNKYEDEDEGQVEMMFSEKPRPSPPKRRRRFQCGTCKKIFRSYQALGGHRASHKKLRSCLTPTVDTGFKDAGSPEAKNDGHIVVHVCPICFREFASGQALGGHKRSHLSSSTAAITFASPPRTAKLGESLFDLNLPAVSQPEFVTSSPV